MGFEIDYFHRAPPRELTPAGGWWGQTQIGHMGFGNDCGVGPRPLTVVSPAPVMGGGNSESRTERVVFNEMAAENSKLPPY
ncbi:heat shock transcription factor, partial [Trifolium medium]|nr:heat shock transcription factor [Trifolium medium]